MAKVDQRRFDNQRSELLGSREAARQLGVKLRTLYAYASRGLIESVPSGRGRTHLYSRADVERLKARSDARTGHGPVAAAALRWGEPVLETAITAISSDGPSYRAHPAIALALGGATLEEVAELLWTGERRRDASFVARGLGASAGVYLRVSCGLPVIERLALALALIGASDATRFVSEPNAELARARAILRRLTAALAVDRRTLAAALHQPTLARALCTALGVRASDTASALVDAALVSSADHELNASTFAARVAASTGADLYACLSAALATLSGPLHGAASDRVEALLDEVGSARRASRVVAERFRRGEPISGFGHPLYADGDPRARVLVDRARRAGPEPERLRALLAVMRALESAGGPRPNLDLGLVAVRIAAGLPRGAAAALFAIGRCSGWVAHVIEQRSAGFILRPRARYVGPQKPTSESESSAQLVSTR